MNHDDKGRTQSLTDNPGDTYGYLTGMTYNIAGQVTGLTLGNGVVETYGYDGNRLQLTTQTAVKGANSRMNLPYGYQASAGQMGAGSTAGNAGQLMGISGTIHSTTESAAYTYDNLGRLVTSNQTSNGSSAQRRFAYDRWGNRTGVWDAVSGGNQIQSITLEQSGGAPTNRITSVTSGSTLNYSYDAAGNVTNDGVHSYTYDAENRLVSVDQGATAQYKYDHQNRRVTKIVGSAWTHYIWQGAQVIAEHDATTAYSTNPPYQEKSARLDYIYSGGRMIHSRQRVSSTAPWTTQYYLSDRLSVRMTLDSSGNVSGRQAHLPYGEDFGEIGAQDKHHLTSYERDNETTTDYAINRGYSRLVGRFAQADPYRPSGRMIGPQTWNRYSYTRNDPINRTDHLGLQDEPIRIGVTACYGGGYADDFSGGCPSGGSGTAGRHGKLEDTGSEEIGGGRGGQLPFAPLVLSLLRSRFDKMLRKNGNKCGNFVQDLINQVAKDTGEAFFSDDALGLFDTISGPQGGGYLLEQATDDGVPIGGTVRGGIGNSANPPTVIISPITFGGSDFNLRAAHDQYALTALHETIHLATDQGIYSDRELATAVINLGGLSQAEIDAYNRLDPNDVPGNSKFWNKYLKKHCD